MSKSLLTFQTLVESPFIIVKIGDYSFGQYDKKQTRNGTEVTFPNMVQDLSVTKTNGDINQYNVRLTYAITQGDDPNMMDKVFSSVSQSRKITFSYGDFANPSFIYKEETGIITNVTSNINFQNSTIDYTISATSDALSLKATNYSFPKQFDKPSKLIKQLLFTKEYGLQNIFTAMRSQSIVEKNNWIADDDQSVEIQAKKNINIIDYLNYLVNCMVYNGEKDQFVRNSRYYMSIKDETFNEFGGTYFTVTKINTRSEVNQSLDTYELDIGYPSENYVVNFNIQDNQTYSIFYDYSSQIKNSNYISSIDNQGNVVTQYVPAVTKSSKLNFTTEANKNWWSNMTQFPIKATLTIKGLLRPAMLMSYVKINSTFYGTPHSSSGLYVVTKQQDTIGYSGYRTTLELTRIGNGSNTNSST